MMPATEETRRPGRPKREEATQAERRRRKGGTTDKLMIPDSVKKQHPEMEFRWARDDGGRMQQLTINDDWDKVPGVDPIHGGKGEAGTAMKMHLLMKPKAFMDEDRREKESRNRAIVQDRLAHPDAKKAVEQGAEMYSVPGNKL
jgi:hypothetical protein